MAADLKAADWEMGKAAMEEGLELLVVGMAAGAAVGLGEDACRPGKGAGGLLEQGWEQGCNWTWV